MTRSRGDRRKHPRVESKIPLKVKEENFDVTTVTKNISCNGVLCQIEGYFPLLSKVKVILLLPSCGKIKVTPVNVEGIVVRSEPVKSSGKSDFRDVAIFFNKINKKDMLKISSYINSVLAKKIPY
ncbi:MAG: PilZ domain-containing protein [Candidatus Omnitrophota bacterium]